MSIKSDPTLIERAKKSPCPVCSKSPRGSGEFCRDDVHDVTNDSQCAAACEQQGAVKYAFAKVRGSKETRCYCEGMTGMKGSTNYSSSEGSTGPAGSDSQSGLSSPPPATNLLVHGSEAGVGHFSCGPYKMVTGQNGDYGISGAKAPEVYFDPMSVDSLKPSRCGCDASMMEKYNCSITSGGQGNIDVKTGSLRDPSLTLSSIFNTAVNKNKNGAAHLYRQFEMELEKTLTANYGVLTPAQKLEKLKGLVAFETCRFNNVSNPRAKGKINPNDADTTEKEILDSWFSKFSTVFKIIVVIMLIHITFRTLVPKGGDVRDSLLYAMTLPPEFMANSGYKSITILVTLVIVFITMGGLLWSHLGDKKQPSGTKALLNFYLPYSLESFMKGGLMMSIYAMLFSLIIGYSMNKAVANKSVFEALAGTIGVVVVYLAWGFITAAVLHEKPKDVFDPKAGLPTGDDPGNPIGIVMLTLTVISIIALISGAIAVAGGSRKSGIGDFSAFIVASAMGTFPLAVFFILLNFTIAHWNPAAEMGLLMLYRMAGALWSFNPKGGIGKAVLSFLGVRPTDKWVMPFLPWLALPIKFYYKFSSNQKPGYFLPRSTVTGVSNTDMWLS